MKAHRSFSWPYVPIPESLYYWGPVTSSINWCEEDYVVTKYIAEFCNTTTNLVFVVLATIAIYNAIRYHYERRILLSSFGYLLVGIGSWLFHMTLKYEYQLLDELPMIYTTLVMFWGIFEYNTTAKQSIGLGVATVGLGVAITWYYLVNKNPTFHEVAFGLITFATLVRSWWLAFYVEDRKARKDLRYTGILGATTFLGGFALWGIDRAACTRLTHTKHWMGLPWGFILELHGWWHVFTGIGVAMFIVFLAHLRLHLTGRQDEFDLVYFGGFWPYLVRRSGYKLLDNDHEA